MKTRSAERSAADFRAIDSPEIYQIKRGPCEMLAFHGEIDPADPKHLMTKSGALWECKGGIRNTSPQKPCF